MGRPWCRQCVCLRSGSHRRASGFHLHASFVLRVQQHIGQRHYVSHVYGGVAVHVSRTLYECRRSLTQDVVGYGHYVSHVHTAVLVAITDGRLNDLQPGDRRWYYNARQTGTAGKARTSQRSDRGGNGDTRQTFTVGVSIIG